MPKSISVLIADDHAVSSGGLQQLLASQEEFEVLEPVATGLDAVALARLEQPGLAVLDYAMPGLNGLDAMREIRRWSRGTRVAILTGSRSDALMSSLIAAGVDGLFLKSTDPEKILSGLKNVVAGQTVIGDDIHPTTMDNALSRRELQVLGCIAEGLTNGGAAEHLSISVKTVESHRASLMRKLDVRSTASLLVRAMQMGLIDP